MRCRTVFVVLLSSLVAACSRTAPPAPFELHTHAGAPSLSEPLGPHPDRVAVASGDTLYGLSRRYGVPMRAIIDANGLQPPYRLAAGKSIALPQIRTHTVGAGDTLASVARQYGVDASTLAATNRLAPPYDLRAGETLILPAQVQVAATTTSQPAPPPAVASAPLPPLAAVPPQPPSPPPSSSPPAAAPARPPALATSPPPSSAAAAAPRIDSPAVPPPEPAAAPPPPPQEQAPPARAAEPGLALALPPAGAKGFLWPVHGRIVASYGTGPTGTHNDGINIAAAEGTPVLAADAGEVAYAGNELKGYGNLVLLKHASGFITAYAHNETLLVKRGDKVARGQPIAKLGATGAVSDPQLHFEIRKGSRVLDPMDYLPAQAATASR